jgi:Txe/YoeB family toxin of toxin-antitoxin system
MSTWKIVYTQDALKDRKTAFEAGYKDKIEQLLFLLEENPFSAYPPFEKLIGDMSGAFSRRINHQHRLVYSVHKEVLTVRILSMWLHYE